MRAFFNATDMFLEPPRPCLGTLLRPLDLAVPAWKTNTRVHAPLPLSTTVTRSVVDPLRRLAFDPLAATKRNDADRVLLARREPRRYVQGRTDGGSVLSPETMDGAT